MHPARLAPLTIACLLAACSDPSAVLHTADGRLRVLADCAPAQLTAAMQQHPSATTIVAFTDAIADVAAAASAASGAARPILLAAGPAARNGLIQPDALIEPNTGADIAVAIALLVHHGIAVPESRIELGVRIVKPTNRAAGGVLHAGPGGVYLASVRSQHAAILAPNPSADTVLQVGLVCAEPKAPWLTRLFDAVRDEARRFPQLELITPDDGEAPAAFAERAVARGCRALIAVTDDPSTSAAIDAAGKRANDKARVVVLDPMLAERHAVCSIGCPADAIGRALETEIAMLLPAGGDLLLCSDATPFRRYQRNGFVAAMQLVGR